MLFRGQSVRALLEALCQTENISLPQFNILRILKGVYPQGHPRSEIRKRMIDKSDVTRLIDKLEENGLAKRIGAMEDKRHSLTVITKKGIQTLERLDNGFANAHKEILSKLDKSEIATLVSLLKKM